MLMALINVARLLLVFRLFPFSFYVVLTRRTSRSKLQTCIIAQENAAKEQRKYQAKLLNRSCFQLRFVEVVDRVFVFIFLDLFLECYLVVSI